MPVLVSRCLWQDWLAGTLAGRPGFERAFPREDTPLDALDLEGQSDALARLPSLVNGLGKNTSRRNDAYLSSEVEWLGRRYVLHWSPRTEQRPAGWCCDGPVGVDQFGLFAEFSVKGVVQRCRWIPAGTFLMGSPASEPGRDEDEGPQHEVRLSGYWLADTACTQALWQAVMGDNPAHFKSDYRNPVEMVSWEDCKRFFKKLNNLVPGLNAGFPTEPQWEYACRAGRKTAFSFGDKFNRKLANVNSRQTVPVASLPPNPWGLYEMHGNVWEWCLDLFCPYSAEPSTDPEGPSKGHVRVLRGGSWFNVALGARSACRTVFNPRERQSFLGLRVALGRIGPAESDRTVQSSPYQDSIATRARVAEALARIAGDDWHHPNGGAERVSWGEQRAVLERKSRKPRK